MKRVLMGVLLLGLVAAAAASPAWAQDKKVAFSLNAGVQTNIWDGSSFDKAVFTLDGRVGIALGRSFEISPEFMAVFNYAGFFDESGATMLYPMSVLRGARARVRSPVLAIFGDRDSNGDPIQGAYAWRKALEKAGNRNFRVQLYPGVDHFMVASESSCIRKQMKTFDQVLQEQGYGPMEESFVLFQQEPGQHTPFSGWPYAPGYLDLMEEWLTNLPQ